MLHDTGQTPRMQRLHEQCTDPADGRRNVGMHDPRGVGRCEQAQVVADFNERSPCRDTGLGTTEQSPESSLQFVSNHPEVGLKSRGHHRCGTNLAAFIMSIIGRGKTISGFLRSSPSTMNVAASDASMMNGIGKVFTSVIGVRTNPGDTVTTSTPVPRKSHRSDSSRLSCAALLGP